MTQLTFLSAEPPAKASALPDCEKDWMIRVATSPSPLLPLLSDIGPAGWFGRTSPEPYRPGQMCREVKRWEERTPEGDIVTKHMISTPSSQGLQKSGIIAPGGSLTLSIAEWTGCLTPSLSAAAVCSLSDILVTGDVPPQYYLTAKACRGILRRAEKRGKELPGALNRALESVARIGPDQASAPV